MRIKNAVALASLLMISLCTIGQNLTIPVSIGESHPRSYGKEMTRQSVTDLVEKKRWAAEILEKSEGRVESYLAYCEKEPDWLLSRLQMYWNTKSITPYIKGGVFDHAEGTAPAPTVKFPGTRDHRSDYRRPKLEDILPYMDDPRGLYYVNKSKDKLEWTSIASTGRNIESVNRDILRIARDAAFLYWYTENEKYAKLAFGVLDTYLTGLYYREAPIDLSHGHHQTLVGLTSFEVIQEHYIAEVTETYDFLYGYIQKNHPDKMPTYLAALRKWADQVIKNGVSFNNWNLFQAGHVSRIALVLENDSQYEDGRGAQYYLNKVMNQSSVRQWSMNKLIESGYDLETGIWFESPGYALGVLRDFIHFAAFYDRNFDIDLIEELPVLRQAVVASPQYLFPNGYWVGFGDGHYKKLEAGPVLYMIENAQKFGKEADEALFTKMLKTFFDEEVYAGRFKGRNLNDLFVAEPLEVSKSLVKGSMEDFTSPLFYAPNTSWLVQRQLNDGENDLMISQIGSLGNHMHSNGIAMELYGYGMPLAPDMGHGSSYFSIEYAEYYTQFPAHNTVAVNGRSKYPEMKANHPFILHAAYPESGQQTGSMSGITYSDVSFLEPETNSDQRRVMGIVSDEVSGYYIDIFRSRQNQGKDIKHEYFYHNLGQKFEVMDTEGNPLQMEPTEKMAFGDGDLMSYDYLWNKTSIQTSENVLGRFSFEMAERTVNMNVWTKGMKDRELFSALSPKNTAFRHGPIPEAFNDLPVPTMVIRQNGEAWNNPFVTVFEPALNGKTAIESVDYFGEGEQVGIHVINKSGREDFVLSNVSAESFAFDGMELKGNYGVVSTQGGGFKMLLGHGKSMRYDTITLQVESTATATFESSQAGWYVSASEPVCISLSIQDTKATYELMDADGNVYKGNVDKRAKKVCFNLPKIDRTGVTLKKN